MYHPYGGDNYVGTGVPRRFYGILNPNICRLRYMPKGREGMFCFDSMKASACVRFVVVSVLPLRRFLANMFSILSCFPPFSLIICLQEHLVESSLQPRVYERVLPEAGNR